MLYWAYILFSIALAAGLVGFGGESSAVTLVAQALFFTFVLLAFVLVALKIYRDESRDMDQRRLKG